MVTSRTSNNSSNADASTPKANNYKIYSTSPEWLFNRHSSVFRRAVNFFPQSLAFDITDFLMHAMTAIP